MGKRIENIGNPEYTITSPTLQKFRFKARDGLSALSRSDVQAYGEAVEKAVLSARRSALNTNTKCEPRPCCASGTWHSEGEDIHHAIRQQQRTALLSCPSQIRRSRTPHEWLVMYKSAMEDKRVAQKTAQSQRNIWLAA